MNQQLGLIKTLLSKGKVEQAFELLLDVLENDTTQGNDNQEYYDEVVLLSSNWIILNRKYRKGIINSDQETLGRNVIINSMIGVLNSISNPHSRSNKERFEDVYTFSNSAVRKKINTLNVLMNENKNLDLILDLGICYLKLDMYDMCLNEMQKALASRSDDPRVYFYMAIAFLENRPIKSINHSTAKKVYQYLKSAILLDNRREFEMLLMILKEEYYRYNGLQIPGISVLKHLENMNLYDSVVVDYKNLERYVNFSTDKLKALYESFM